MFTSVVAQNYGRYVVDSASRQIGADALDEPYDFT
jgi:hypothetical protein